MNNQHIGIDETWYYRLPSAKDRIAAGGVVLRQEDQCVYLALAREADIPPFVLPKGEVEPGESLEAAARREILEEVGLSDLQLIGPLGVLERLSYNKQYWIQTHYFLFTTPQKEGIPTDTQHHSAVWWFPIDALPAMLWPEQRRLIETHAHSALWAGLQREYRYPSRQPTLGRKCLNLKQKKCKFLYDQATFAMVCFAPQ